jgi:soluble lytic murein transglycosylase-like protein
MLIVLSSALTFIDTVQAEPVSIGHPVSLLPADPVATFVAEASRRFRVPVPWIRAVIRVESAGVVRALSRRGAMGLMQIMPATWEELRLRYGLGADPYDPRDNILAGTAFISELRERYGVFGFLAAYNAGPGSYEEHLETGRDLPAETQAYVATLMPMIAGGQIDGKTIGAADPLAWRRAPLFIARAESKTADPRAAADPQPDRPPSASPGIDLSALVPQSRDLFVRLVSEVGWQ